MLGLTGGPQRSAAAGGEGSGWSWAGVSELGQARLAGQAGRAGWVAWEVWVQLELGVC